MWKLHVQAWKIVDEDFDDIEDLKMLIMEIRSLDHSSSGFLELHFMDIRLFKREGYPADSYIRKHQPYIWSINIGHVDSDVGEVSPKRIIHFAVSGDGNYAATLAASETYLLLELWDLRPPRNPMTRTRAFVAGTRQEALQGESPAPFRPRLSTGTLIPFTEVHDCNLEYSYNVSMSWDSSQVALTDASKAYRTSESDSQSLFAVYNHIPNPQSSATTSGSTAVPLTQSKDYQRWTSLDGYYGYGKFHFTDIENQEPCYERFVTCGGISVEVYGVLQEWRLLHTINLVQPLDGPVFGISSAMRLIRTLRGKHLAWNNIQDHPEIISVWDLETELMTSTHWKKGYDSLLINNDTIAFSSNGSAMAIGLQKVITIYCAETGAIRGSFRLPEFCDHIIDIAFVHGDAQMLVSTDGRGDDTNRHGIGLIVDAFNLTITNRFSIMNSWRPRPTGITFNDNLFCASESTLDLVRLQDRIFQPYSQPDSTACDEQCKSKLVPLNQQQPTKFRAPSGMQFKVRMHRKGGPHVVISAFSSNGLPSKNFTLPKSNNRRGDGWDYKCAAIPKDRSHLVVISDTFVTIWGLPATLHDDYTLLLAWKMLENDDFWTWKCEFWYTCPHRQIYAGKHATAKEDDDNTSRKIKELFSPRVERVFCSKEPQRFLLALHSLIGMFVDGDQNCKNAILQYVGSQINNYPNPADQRQSVLANICQAWNLMVHDDYKQFLKALLQSSFGHWIPLTKYNRESDPLLILIDHAQTQPRAIEMAEILVRYCIHQARVEKDQHFLLPIMKCLRELLHPKQIHSEFGLRILRRLAFIPVKNRSFIIDHHSIIVHPTKFPWQFWKSSTQSLHEFSDAILQPMHYPQAQAHDPSNNNFTRDLFVAPFWTLLKSNSDDDGADDKAFVDPAPSPLLGVKDLFHFITISLYSALWMTYVIFHMTNYNHATVVECHEFTLEALDNPAVAALIEYKWNTIGFKYWLIRFLGQCCFYLLVLVAVFFQIYGDHNRPLTSLYVAITCGSIILLWFKLLQVQEKKQYISRGHQPVRSQLQQLFGRGAPQLFFQLLRAVYLLTLSVRTSG
ncbi:hypothetical protein BC939DRAFT_226889 [Gamsiella multidivaricata]|uniref:uncharacterized protein n=1 Tax=Gamsiella multidivaricata TaxID=101098 RepID=UPI00221FC8A4|nr:uncharacterized protein BC939DRAFT_226889 [Gamsiella multidivaricata]KAI7831330.1 hypothetical protein BC939DRAFT_226889 [Gamsiella multidivaricata]